MKKAQQEHLVITQSLNSRGFRETNFASDIHSWEVIPRVWLCKSSSLCLCYNLTERLAAIKIVEYVTQCSTASSQKKIQSKRTAQTEKHTYYHLFTSQRTEQEITISWNAIYLQQMDRPIHHYHMKADCFMYGDNHHAYCFTRFTWIYPQSFGSYRQSQGDLLVYWWWEAQPQLWLHKNSEYMTAAGELWVAHTRTPHMVAFSFHGTKTLWIMIGY